MQMPFGKYRDRDLSGIPTDYLAWMIGNVNFTSPFLADAVRAEYQSRVGGRPESATSVGSPDIEGIDAAYRQLARKWHPDRGGSAAAMQAIADFRELMIQLCTDQ